MRAVIVKHGVGWYVWHAIAGAVVLIARFISGLHLDGKPRTNAGLLARGDTPTRVEYRVTWWTAMPILHRAGVRLGITAALAAVLYGLVVAPQLTRVALVTAALLGLSHAIWRAWQAHRARAHRERYIIPIGMSIGPLLGQPCGSTSDIESWVQLPLEFFDEVERAPMRVYVSSRVAYDEKTMRAVEQTISQKLGYARDDLEIKWSMVGAEPFLTLRLAERPPNEVTLDDIRRDIEKTRDDTAVFPFAMAAGRRKISVSLDVDSPHIGFSCRSGVGKSVTVRTLAAIGLYKGAQIVMLDQKMESQPWLRSMPGVVYADNGKAIWEQLVALDEELRRRQEIVKGSFGSTETPDVGPRILIFFEEQNIGMGAVGDYWDSIKQMDEWKGKKNPAVRALFNLSCAGRSVGMNLISVAQYFDVPSTCAGKPAIRENYGVLMIRGKQQAWKMLASEYAPFPKQPKNKRKGRLHIVLDGEIVEIQVAYLSEAEADELARSGGHVTVPAQWGTDPDRPMGGVTEDPVTPLYNLREAVDAGLVGDQTYDWLRQKKARSKGDFPAGTRIGNTTKYTADEIKEWYENTTARTLLNAAFDSEDGDNE